MTILQLIALIEANVTSNGNRENTGQRVREALIEMAEFSDKVNFYDTFGDFPATGVTDMLYIDKATTSIYSWDTVLTTYVLFNDPDVINPDAPEEGQTFYVRLATANRLNTCTYNNGTAGVGATLTATANGIVADITTPGKIDNVVAALGDVILIKNQVAALQNGIYEVTQLGSVSEPFILTRIDGYDETSEVYPSVVFVSTGSNNANRYFTQSTASPVIGTSNLVYAVSSTAQPAAPLLFMDSVTVQSLPSSIYANGTTYPTIPGNGATLTATVNGALGTINGVNMTSGLRLIVKDELTSAYNGTYTVTQAGSATLPWKLTRLVSDNSHWYRNREFVVTNPSCLQFGSRWTVNTPLSMSNLNYGITPILFSQQNILGLRDLNGDIKLTDSSGNYINIEGSNNNSIFMFAQGDANITADNGFMNLISSNFNVSNTNITGQTTTAISLTADNTTDAHSIILTPGSYLSIQTNGDSIFLTNDNLGFTDAFLGLQANSAALRNYSATAQVEVTAGSAVMGLLLDRIGVLTSLYNNEGGVEIRSNTGGINNYTLIKADNGINNGFLEIRADSNGVNLQHDSYVTIGNDNGNNGIEMDGTDLSMYASGNGTLFLNSTHGIRLQPSQAVGNGNKISITNLPIYANDAAAGVGGLTTDMIYKTATGELRIKL